MRKTLDFLLNDWLGVQQLLQRPRFAEHSAETFAGVLDTCERIAREKFAPFNRLVDTQEPHFDGQRVHLPQATHEACAAYAESGMLAASQDFDVGGMQLPCVIEMAANAFFHKASIAMGGYTLLTAGNANLLMAHGSALQRQVFAANEFSGRWFGTMCLSEPQAGSSLSDVATRATPDGADFEADPLGPRYRLRGNKMWISAGEHEITENIIHLVLAKIPGPDGKPLPGTRGISLFIVPKQLVNVSGELTGERNDVALAGLNHKLGYRGTTNTLLNFGEGRFPVRGAAGAIGYLVGKPGDGLRCMFHMMNEARIGVGLGAVMLGMAGYEASLDYARSRPQGRPMTAAGKDAAAPQVPIVQHADVRRMLLAQKAYCEGGLALELYCARLVDEQHTGERYRSRRGPAAAGGADPHRQELAQRVVPGSQQPGHPGARRLRLHARLPGGTVLARPAPEHDPRRHARHPGPGPAGPQGADGRWRGAQAAGRARQRHHHPRGAGVRAVPTCHRTGCGLAEPGRGHQGRLGHRPARRRAGQRHALPAGLRPRGAGLAVAGRGAGGHRPRPPQRHALLLRLRAAQGRGLAGGGAHA
jgi:alkylation response protein AidB-like acyl-CoA dehydrogenase